jgi:hypothetical protein
MAYFRCPSTKGLRSNDLKGVSWKMPFKVNVGVAQIWQGNSAELRLCWRIGSVRVKRGKYLKLSSFFLGLGLLSFGSGAVRKLANEGMVPFEEPLDDRRRPPALEEVRVLIEFLSFEGGSLDHVI